MYMMYEGQGGLRQPQLDLGMLACCHHHQKLCRVKVILHATHFLIRQYNQLLQIDPL
jgi:hypothetical protein